MSSKAKTNTYWESWIKEQVNTLVENATRDRIKAKRPIDQDFCNFVMLAIDAANPFASNDLPQYRIWLENKARVKKQLTPKGRVKKQPELAQSTIFAIIGDQP